MALCMKEILRRTVHSYVEGECPDRLEELDVVFDDVYATIDRRMQESTQESAETANGGLPFDVGTVALGTAITAACLVGAALLRASLKYFGKRGLRKELDRVEKALASRIDRSDLVHKVRVIVEGIAQEL